MKVYRIPSKPLCPLRVQISDNEVAAAIQCRDQDDVPFYWLPVSPELANLIIKEFNMKVGFHLPDNPKDQIY